VNFEKEKEMEKGRVEEKGGEGVDNTG